MNRKTLLIYRLLCRHQNNIIVCIYLCGQFLKTRKVAYENYLKYNLHHKIIPVNTCDIIITLAANTIRRSKWLFVQMIKAFWSVA
ncbi:hypothetical protein UA63_004836 [Salmonella enterica subsp. enterica serovar 4,5:i:-]|nr:hypothetical protein [Salmonella enterica subsp. enterica serovar 4,5:i:-]